MKKNIFHALSTNWFLKLVALILALLLYMSLKEDAPKGKKTTKEVSRATNPINTAYNTITNKLPQVIQPIIKEKLSDNNKSEDIEILLEKVDLLLERTSQIIAYNSQQFQLHENPETTEVSKIPVIIDTIETDLEDENIATNVIDQIEEPENKKKDANAK